MPSNITNYSDLVDTSFPVPGADNDTQGFRNNFGNLVIALNTASQEISELQVIQSALVSLTSYKTITASWCSWRYQRSDLCNYRNSIYLYRQLCWNYYKYLGSNFCKLALDLIYVQSTS
jgi:hypothetical protein